MEPDARYTVVGATVLIAAAALTMFVLWLTGAFRTEKMNQFAIYFENQSLSGLQVDGYVTMRGIRVGRVVDFKISHDNIEHVMVVITVDEDTPVKEDTEAVVTRNVLTGIAAIELANSSQNSPTLSRVRDGHPYPVIKEGRAQLEQLTNNLSTVVENLNHGVDRLNRFLSDDNLKSIESSIRNIEQITAMFADGKEGVSSMAQEVREVVKRFGSLSDHVQSELEKIADALSNTLRNLTLQFGSLSQELGSSGQAIASSVQGLDNARSLITGPNPESYGPGETVEDAK